MELKTRCSEIALVLTVDLSTRPDSDLYPTTRTELPSRTRSESGVPGSRQIWTAAIVRPVTDEYVTEHWPLASQYSGPR